MLHRGSDQRDSFGGYGRLSEQESPSLEDIEKIKTDLTVLAKLGKDRDNGVFDTGLDSEDFGAEPAVRKRPFCNGFTGCGRIGKRSSLLLQKLQLPNQDPVEAIAKRPFCNGFFGCGNPGKRLVFRNARIVNRNILSGPLKALNHKRFFCNPGAFGCSNQGKRSPYQQWLEKLRTKMPGLILE